MSDLERLDEALERVHHDEAWPMGLNTRVALGEVCEAARAYRDLLANGPIPATEFVFPLVKECLLVYPTDERVSYAEPTWRRKHD